VYDPQYISCDMYISILDIITMTSNTSLDIKYIFDYCVFIYIKKYTFTILTVYIEVLSFFIECNLIDHLVKVNVDHNTCIIKKCLIKF